MFWNIKCRVNMLKAKCPNDKITKLLIAASFMQNIWLWKTLVIYIKMWLKLKWCGLAHCQACYEYLNCIFLDLFKTTLLLQRKAKCVRAVQPGQGGPGREGRRQGDRVQRPVSTGQRGTPPTAAARATPRWTRGQPTLRRSSIIIHQ